MTKEDEGFLKARSDPAVAAILEAGQRRQSERSLPKADRAKVKKAKDKQAARIRAVYDLPEDLIKEYADIAKKHRVTASQLVMIALRYFRQSGVDIGQFKVVSEKKSPLYDYRLIWFDSTSYEGEEK